MKKMHWWGWIGIFLVVAAAVVFRVTEYPLVWARLDLGPSPSDGQGLGMIGYAISQLRSTVLILTAGIMIWKTAQK